MRIIFKLTSLMSLFFLTGLVSGCREDSDEKMYRLAQAHLQEYYEKMDFESSVKAFECFRQIKGKRYQKLISIQLLSDYFYLGKYEEGTKYRETLTEDDVKTPVLLLVYPAFYDIMELADNGQLDEFNTKIWEEINGWVEEANQSAANTSKDYLDAISAAVSLFANGSSFDGELFKYYSENKMEEIIPCVKRHSSYVFSPEEILQDVAPYREAYNTVISMVDGNEGSKCIKTKGIQDKKL